MSSWPVSVRRAGRFDLSRRNARPCGPSLDMQRSGVGVLPGWRWEFVVREFRNTMAGPKLQRGRRFGDSLDSASGSSPSDLRAKAILLLFAIYGLRSSEVAGLQSSYFDWRNETFSVRRAKRGGVQQYPIQYEVGEAIIQYLQKGRKRCSSRHVFLSKYPPHGRIGPGPMWQIVGRRMQKLGIELEHVGPHSLRHACATRLLQKGASLREIADFLGHRNIKSIGIYARYDTRS